MHISCIYSFDEIANKWIVEVNPLDYERAFPYSVSSGESLHDAMRQLKNTLVQVFGLDVSLHLQSAYTYE